MIRKGISKAIKLGKLVICITIELDSSRKYFRINFEVFLVRELIDQIESYLEEEAKARSGAER